jgi:hypothetical protein
MIIQTKNPTAGGAAGLENASLPGGTDCPSNAPETTPAQEDNRARLRRQCLVEHLHKLGPAPLGYFLREVKNGASVTDHLERYSRIDPEFVRALGGDRYAPVFHAVEGGRL